MAKMDEIERAKSLKKGGNCVKIIRRIYKKMRVVFARGKATNRTRKKLSGKQRKKLLRKLILFAAVLAVMGLSIILFASHGTKRQLKRANIGDTVTFGSYEQDDNTENGKEAIEWIVLSKDSNQALLISKYGLDAKPYNEEWTSITWENCTLRKWLNEEFFQTAFTAKEQARIVTAKVTADANPNYSTAPGNDTKDKVWLLSIAEANKYFINDAARVCSPTRYATSCGVWTNNDTGMCWWWLRTPGRSSDSAAGISTDGRVRAIGYDFDTGCVRPVVMLRFS